jgi:FF domain
VSREDSPVPEEKTLDVFAIRDINAIDKKDAAEAFRKFLDEKNVPSNINWENCVKIIQSDKRFDVWKKFSDRKQAFNQYKIQKQVSDNQSINQSTNQPTNRGQTSCFVSFFVLLRFCLGQFFLH